MDDKNKYMPRHASLDDTQKFFKDDLSNSRVIRNLNKINDNSIHNDNNNNNDNKDNNEEGFWTSKIKLVKGYDQEKEKKSYNKVLKIIYVIFIILFLILFAFSCYKIYLWLMDNKKTDSITDIINDKVTIKDVDDENATLVSEEDDKDNPYWYYIKFPLIDVDISSLKKINSDVIGWINVNNTNINYPFVQTTDNEYYLNHSIDKSINEAGWIFLDYRNSSDFDNKNSILYAHSRLNKTMFGSLSKVLKENWYRNEDNHIIRISLDKSSSLWQIFSVYKIKEENYYITTNFSNNEEYLKFLDTLKKRSLYDFNTTLKEDDKILTLSTCYSETERTVVHAKLIKKSKKD